jgi:hypothetical protein
MKRSSYHLLAALMLATFTACSKKETPAASTPPPDPVPAQQSDAANAGRIGQLENQVGTALQQKNYTVAVDSLAQVSRDSQKLSDAQRIQYMQQLKQTMDALAQAAQTDPAAKAAYDRLGRVATGR